MKFIVLLRKYFISILLFILVSEETKSAKLETKETSLQPIIKNITTKVKTKPDIIQRIKNIELISLPKNKKFYISSKEIKKKEIVTELPLNKVIFIENPTVKEFCESLKIPEFSKKRIFNYQLECLTLFTLDQLKKPNESFKHYFEPAVAKLNFTNFFLLWPKEDLEIIKNSLLENTLKDMRLTINDYLELLQKSSYRKPFEFDDLKKAFILMNSQHFKLKIHDKVYNALFPFMDIYDIYPSTNVDWSFELKSLNDTAKLFALNDIHKGDPIITNYGEMDNLNLLVNFGFTVDKNPFPIESEFFFFEFDGKEYPITLKQGSAKEIFDTVKRIRVEKLSSKITKGRFSSPNYKLKQDLQVFEEMLIQLSKFSNKKRLENLLNNLYDTPNAENIFRALQAEDILIDVNAQKIAEIIKILTGKTEIDDKVKSRELYKSNKDYFDSVLPKENENNLNEKTEKGKKIVVELNKKI